MEVYRGVITQVDYFQMQVGLAPTHAARVDLLPEGQTNRVVSFIMPHLEARIYRGVPEPGSRVVVGLHFYQGEPASYRMFDLDCRAELVNTEDILLLMGGVRDLASGPSWLGWISRGKIGLLLLGLIFIAYKIPALQYWLILLVLFALVVLVGCKYFRMGRRIYEFLRSILGSKGWIAERDYPGFENCRWDPSRHKRALRGSTGTVIGRVLDFAINRPEFMGMHTLMFRLHVNGLGMVYCFGFGRVEAGLNTGDTVKVFGRWLKGCIWVKRGTRPGSLLAATFFKGY
jgi:hypothetical protein